MSTRQGQTGLSTALSNLDAPLIIKHLSHSEHCRQISVDKTAEVLHADQSKWIELEDWERQYLVKIEESSQEGNLYFWSIDLAWRRYILDQETLAPSLNLSQIRSLIDSYLQAPLDPYSVEGYNLEQGLEFVVQCGEMYDSIATEWEQNGRPRGWIDQVVPTIETDNLVRMTKKYVKGVRKARVRVLKVYEKQNSSSRPLLEASPSQPVSPSVPGFGRDNNDENDLSLRQSPRIDATNAQQQPTNQSTTIPPSHLESSQFLQPLAKPTYLSRVSHSPSASSAKERSGSPFGGTPRRGLPPGIRSMAVQTQSKLAKVRRSSEIHLQQERVKAESVERAMSEEARQSREISQVVERAEKEKERSEREEEKNQKEREKTEEFEADKMQTEEEEARNRPLTATPSGILMPPPPSAKSAGASPARGVDHPPSSGEEPSTLAEPSTILSSPPRPSPDQAQPPRSDAALTAPTSSIDEGEPSTQRSSQDYPFPTAAQPGPPHVSLALRVPLTSSFSTSNRTVYSSEVESQGQGESQSQPTDSEPSSQAAPGGGGGGKVIAATDMSRDSSASSSAERNPTILVPDTSLSNNADSSNPSSSNSLPALPSSKSNTKTLLPPAKTRSTSRGPSLEPNPPPSPNLRRSARLSKSPAPPEIERTVRRSSRQPSANLLEVEQPHVSSNESQAFFTQAAPVDSQEIATQAQDLSATSIVEEEEQGGEPQSQESSGLTYVTLSEESQPKKEKVTVTMTTTRTVTQGRHTRFQDDDEEPGTLKSAARGEKKNSTRTSPDSNTMNEQNSDSFGSQDKQSHSKQISFGELENQASRGYPVEEELALDLEDDEDI
ncbi:uncharacterized protein JCM6883_006986 [Sporobolomyces salmoneus]|uniref:uncharacterized protein n=1 Tax=Sporobolomyces salmoneus TaxID=183962 RepID=UPI00316ECCFA